MQIRQKWRQLQARSGQLILENGDIEIYPHPFNFFISSERENTVASEKLKITSLDQLVQILEERMEESRERVGNERIKAKSSEREGQVQAYADAVSLVRNFSRNQE